MVREKTSGASETFFGILGLLMVFIKLYDGLYTFYDWLLLVVGGVAAVINLIDLYKINQTKNNKKNET